MNISPSAGRANQPGRESAGSTWQAPGAPGPAAAIDRYLRRYVLRRRLLSFGCSVGWALAFFLAAALSEALLDRLFAFPRRVRLPTGVFIAIITLSIIMPPIAAFFRRFDPVRAAVAIEGLVPVFDQRLVTVASDASEGLLIAQLRGEVEALVDQPGSRPSISLKQLLPPWIAVVLMVLLILSLWPSQRLGMSTLVSRFLFPLSDISQ